MTFAEFKKKWARYTGKESSAYQEHFNDLCRLLAHQKLDVAVAAAAGVMKDWNEEVGGAPVQAPILGHPQFERLEAEGEASGFASRLRRVSR